MASIADIRNQFPDKTAGLTDLEIADTLARKTGRPLALVAGDLGVEIPKQNSGLMGDTFTALKAGAQQVPGMITGLVDIPFGLAGADRPISKGWDYIGEATGFQPGSWARDTQREYSPGTVAARSAVDAAEGFWDSAGAFATNPRAAYVAGVESVPSMVAGGVAGRGLMAVAPRVGGAVAGATGEGAVMAGQSMDSINSNVDPRTAAIASLGIGVAGGAVGLAGSKLANRLGLEDVDVLATGSRQLTDAAPMSIYKRVPAGFVQEGFLEEAPQSAIEQMGQNWAEGKDITDGLGKAVAAGIATGGLMGGATNVMTAPRRADMLARREETDLLSTDQRLQQFGDRYRFAGLANAGLQTEGDGPHTDVSMLRRGTQDFGNTDFGSMFTAPTVVSQPTPVALVPQERTADYGNTNFSNLGITGLRRPAPQSAPTETTVGTNLQGADLGSMSSEDLMRQLVPTSPDVSDAIIDGSNLSERAKAMLKQDVRDARDKQSQSATAKSEPPVPAAPTLEAAKSRKDVKTWLDTQLQSGAITPEQHADAINHVDQAKGANAKLEKIRTKVGAILNPPKPMTKGEIFDASLASIVGDENAGIFDAVFNQGKTVEAVGQELGINKSTVSRRVGQARNAVLKHLAEAHGVSTEVAADILREYFRAQRNVQAADTANLGMSPASQASALDEQELFGSENGAEQHMGTIETVGGSQGAVGRSELPPSYVDSVEPNDNARAAAAANRQQHLQDLLNHPESRTALNDWDREDVTLHDLVQSQDATTDYLADYIEAVANAEELGLDEHSLLEHIDKIQAAIADDIKKGRYGPEQSIRGLEQNQSGDAGVDGSERPDVRQIGQGVQVEAAPDAGNSVRGKEPAQTGTSDEDVINADADGVRYSKSATTQGTTAESIRSSIKKLFLSPARFDQKVKVVQAVDEIPADVRRSAKLESNAAGVQAFVLPDGTAWMIADNIAQGSELAVFLHEVGAHLGLQKLLGETNYNRLAMQVKNWAVKNDGSLESEIAKKALARVKAAQRDERMELGEVIDERIAYFIEEAVKAGIDPTAVQNIKAAGLREWFRQFMAAMKVALRKVGLGRFDSLTAQNIVDLAYGAADLELNGTYHGTAADFRRFDHRYMGSGEGAQAFGWGTYLAQKYGIAKGYWADDVKRKQFDGVDAAIAKWVAAAVSGSRGVYSPSEIAETAEAMRQDPGGYEDILSEFGARPAEGSIMAVRPLIGEHEMLDWDESLYKQSPAVKAAYEKARFDDSLGTDLDGVIARKTDDRNGYVGGVASGQDFYRALERLLGSDKKASEYLDSIGIKGIKFLDAQSRYGSYTIESFDDFYGPHGLSKRDSDSNFYAVKDGRAVQGFDNIRDAQDWVAAENAKSKQTRNIVVFNDKNIARVATQVGANPDKIKFSQGESNENVHADRDGNEAARRDAIQRIGDFGLRRNGNLRVFWHSGTAAGGNLRVDKAGSRATSTPSAALGIWLTEDQEYSARWGEPKPYFITLENPITVSGENFPSVDDYVALRKKYLAQGYDGMILLGRYGAKDQVVIFKDNGAVSAHAPIQSRNKVRFSKNYTESLPKDLQEPARDIVNGLKNAGRVALNYAAFTSDLVEMAKKFMPAVGAWYDSVHALEVERIQQEQRVEAIAAEFADMERQKFKDSTGRQRFKDTWSAIHLMTREQVWGYQPTWRAPVDINPAAAAAYNKLDNQQRDLLDRVFKHGHDQLTETQAVLDETIANAYADELAEADTSEKKAIVQRKIDRYKAIYGRELAKMKGPYAPMRRVGSHVVVAKSQAYLDAEAANDTKELEKLKAEPTHFHVEFVDSMVAAQRKARELDGRFEFVKASEKDAYMQDNQLPFRAFEQLRRMVDEKDKRNGEGAKKLNAMITELYLTSLAETSSRKSEMKRDNVAGIEDHMFKAFVSKGRASAHYIAQLKIGKTVGDNLATIRQQAHDHRDERAMMLFNELYKRYTNATTFNPSPVVNKLMAVNSVWSLLTKPAYYFYNLTQPTLMTQPWLSQKHGYKKSGAAMLKAYKELTAIKGYVKQPNFSVGSMPADVRAAMQDLMNQGKLDITIAQDLGEYMKEGDGEVSRAVNWANQKLRFAAQKVETTNRIVTGIAAYRLEHARLLKEGRSPAAAHSGAVEYAAKAIDETQGDYSNLNAPRLMNATSIQRLVTQFRKFQLIQISFLVRMVKDATVGGTKEEKAAARAALMYVLGHHAVLAGAMGLPAANLVALAFSAFGDDDDDRDLELEARKALGNGFAADLLTRGVPAAVFNINLSNNVGMGQAFSIMPYEEVDLSRDGYSRMLTAMSGPFFGGLAPRAVEGMGKIYDGDFYRGMEGLLPSGFAATARALREMADGQTNSREDVLVSPEEISMLATVGKALGFRMQSDSTTSLIRSRKYELEQFFNERTSLLKNRYAAAYRDGDGEELAEIREHWQEMQAFKRDYGFKPQPLSNLLKAPADQRKRERQTRGGVQYNSGSEGFVEQYEAEE